MGIQLGRISVVSAFALLVFVIGVLGLSGFFSDLGPGESERERIAFVVGVYVVGGGLLGALLPRRWYLAVLSAWGPLLVSAPGLLVPLSRGQATPYWSYILLGLVGAPAVAVAAGFAGSRIRLALHKSRPASSGRAS